METDENKLKEGIPAEEIKNEELFEIKAIQKLRDESNMEPNWLVKGLIEDNSSSEIYSGIGIGKSWLALHLADCISKGAKFMNEFDCTQKRVLYLDYENGETEIGRRHKMLSENANSNLDVSFSPPFLDDFKTELNAGGGAGYKLLTFLSPQFIQKYDIIVVDTLRDSFTGDENQSKDVNKVNTFIRFVKLLGKSIIVLHHTTKSDSNVSRGSSAINAKFDNIFQLDEVNDPDHPCFSFMNVKKRRGGRHPTILFDMRFQSTKKVDIEYRETKLQQEEAVRALVEAMKVCLNGKDSTWKELHEYCENHCKGIFQNTRFDKAIKLLRDDSEVIVPEQKGDRYSLKQQNKQEVLLSPEEEALKKQLGEV